MIFDKIKELLLHTTKDGKVTTTKIGGSILSIAAGIITASQVGIEIPIQIIQLAWVALIVGGKMTVDGARNAIDKLKK